MEKREGSKKAERRKEMKVEEMERKGNGRKKKERER